ncbi:MAG: sigma-70 family RNA polymerase sigma factor [Isosphaeraceae bacterium]
MKWSRKPDVVVRDCVVDLESGKTSPTLLDQVRDWQDHEAWLRFHAHYHPLLRLWCRRFGLDDDTSDELCQRIWVELMRRMRTFRYDPSRGFRNWLWRLFRSRAIDLLRNRRVTTLASIDDCASETMLRALQDREPMKDGGEFQEEVPSIFHQQAAEAQEAVRSRVDPQTWSAYWFVAIEGQSVREAAEILGKSYTAVYTGYKRVDRMLRVEGERRLAELLRPSAESLDRPRC